METNLRAFRPIGAAAPRAGPDERFFKNPGEKAVAGPPRGPGAAVRAQELARRAPGAGLVR
jgi:hypothetical protein